MKKIFVVMMMMALCCAACTKAEQKVEQKTLDENEVYWWMQETEIELPKAEAFPKDAIMTEIK